MPRHKQPAGGPAALARAMWEADGRRTKHYENYKSTAHQMLVALRTNGAH